MKKTFNEFGNDGRFQSVIALLFTFESQIMPSLTASRSRAKLYLFLFFLQEREQKQKLLDPTPVRTSQRFSEKHINQKEEVRVLACVHVYNCIADCVYTSTVATFLKRHWDIIKCWLSRHNLGFFFNLIMPLATAIHSSSVRFLFSPSSIFCLIVPVF